MRCPTCEYAGTVHTVRAPSPTWTDRQPAEEFWDEQDSYHVHDPSMKVGAFFCSGGHDWKLSHIGICPTVGCEWNLRPEVRGQATWMIPGRNETMASFRARKITQFLELRKTIPDLYLENGSPHFGTFVIVQMPGGAALLTGQLPRRTNPTLEFVDVTDEEVLHYFKDNVV